jgi:hypothetical protein
MFKNIFKRKINSVDNCILFFISVLNQLICQFILEKKKKTIS